MRGRSSQRRKVAEAKRVVQQALGDATRRDRPEVAKYVPMARPVDPVPVKSRTIGVLTIHEAATRVGISAAEMEAMVKSGKVKTVVAGWTTFVLSDEIARLKD